MADEKQSVSDIVDPRKGLPPATAALLESCYSQGQLRLRDWTMDHVNGEKGAIESLAGIAVCVLDRLAEVTLKKHAGDFDSFRPAIDLEGGAAELGLKYARFIYRDATRGSMPGTWYAPIRNQIFDAISRAELEFWRNYSLEGAENAQTKARTPRDVPGIAVRRKSVVSPILDVKGWSIPRRESTTTRRPTTWMASPILIGGPSLGWQRRSDYRSEIFLHKSEIGAILRHSPNTRNRYSSNLR